MKRETLSPGLGKVEVGELRVSEDSVLGKYV
jgi:hypothetical protein